MTETPKSPQDPEQQKSDGLAKNMAGDRKQEIADVLGGVKFLESSRELDDVYAMARSVEVGVRRPGQHDREQPLRALLVKTFGKENETSFDCYSFMAGVAKRLGKTVVPPPGVDKPDPDAFQSGVDLQDAWVVAGSDVLRSESSAGYRTWLTAFLQNIEKGKQRIPIPPIRGMQEWAAGQAAIRDIVKHACSAFAEKPRSRVLHFSASDTEQKHADVHTCIVLGPTESGDDLLVLEKTGAGGSMQVEVLSLVISRYAANWQYTDLAMHISDDPWQNGEQQ